MRNKFLFFMSVIILWAVSYASISANEPNAYSPYSLATAIPLIWFHEAIRGGIIDIILGTLAIPAFYVLWCFPLLKGQNQIPKRTKIFSMLLVLLSLFSLVGGWLYGIEYQGYTHTVLMILFNLCFWTLLFILALKNARTTSYKTNFLFHSTLFIWLAWVAFPWLGEQL
jgi:hypothetical protein